MARRSRFPSLLLLALACGSPDRGPAGAGAPSAAGPDDDAVVVRIPRRGGVAAIGPWGRDTVAVRTRTRVPPLTRLLGVDERRGSVAALDSAGRLVRIGLRLGTVDTASFAGRAPASADGWAVFGMDDAGRLRRHTPAGPWRWDTPPRTDAVVPMADGSVVLLQEVATGGVVARRLRPPATRLDTLLLPGGLVTLGTPLGDLLWVGGDSGVIGIRMRDFQRAVQADVDGRPRLLATTPSGDRAFVAVDDERALDVLDRWTGRRLDRIRLPVAPSALRMDPEGRYLLVRDGVGDSVRVVAVGTARVIGGFRSEWRDDLPAVTPDGALLVTDGDDVVARDPESRAERRRVAGGAADWWVLVRWDGLRPRAASLDAPVQFPEDSLPPDSVAAAAETDSALAAAMPPDDVPLADLGRAPGAPTPAPPLAAPPAPLPAPPAAAGSPPAGAPGGADAQAGATLFTLQFAAGPRETLEEARQLAAVIRVGGRRARVVERTVEGVPIWRVVMGPYASREAAEADGRRARRSYWVYPGLP